MVSVYLLNGATKHGRLIIRLVLVDTNINDTYPKTNQNLISGDEEDMIMSVINK